MVRTRTQVERQCRDCSVGFMAWSHSDREFCDKCGKRRMATSRKGKGTKPEPGMTAAEAESYLAKMIHLETLPRWMRCQELTPSRQRHGT